MAAALIFITFKSAQREPRLYAKAGSISTYLGLNHGLHFLLLITMAVVASLLPVRSLASHETSAPLLEILVNISAGQHWFVVTFACFCISIGSLSLVEVIHDSRRNVMKMASDGLFFKYFVQKTSLASLVVLALSVMLELLLSTFNLIFLAAFAHLALDSMLGLVVVYRRYCTASDNLPDGLKDIRRRFRNYEHPESTNQQSESDDTDIDAAVDEYKTQV